MSDLVFLLSADIDIQRAFEFYEDCQEGRGKVFLQHLEAAFTSLRSFPEIAPVFHEKLSTASRSALSVRSLLYPRCKPDHSRWHSISPAGSSSHFATTWIAPV